MKKTPTSCVRTLFVAWLLISPPLLTLCACADKDITRPDVTHPLAPDASTEGDVGTVKLSDIKHTVAFSSGADKVNTYRIPAIVTAKDGSLLVFAEARHTTWKDKSHTDIVVKRSTDNGKTWSAMTNLTSTINPGTFAFMDPTPIVEKSTGKIWIFCCRWKKGIADHTQNRAFAVTSTDNGVTWSAPLDVTETVIMPGCYPSGFGPGSGFQVASGRYANRLILPTRQSTGAHSSCVTVYSDDKGAHWSIGTGITPSGECQMGDAGNDQMTLNIRMGGGRRASTSRDGGVTWNAPVQDRALPAPSGGCQASVLGMGDGTVFFCGIAGGTATSAHDDRCKLTLFRSITGAQGWTQTQILYEKGSGYACMTQLNDGSLAIVFEAADTPGFVKIASRPAGWMRLDVMVIPAEITQRGYWFEKE